MNQHVSRFPVAHLANLPTPIVPLSNIAGTVGHPALYMKQDNLSGPEYGGNKIRKLEFLLGEALAQGCKRVITYGAAGSNHALATAICCRQLGLKAISILAPQAASRHVRNNILMGFAAGAEMHLCPHYGDFPLATTAIASKYTQKDGVAPYIIPAGGTNATGALGFVNAAFELADQQEPDVIYIPMGTGGTMAGLLVGLRLAGLRTRVEAVRVTHPRFRGEDDIRRLCAELCAKLGIAQVVDDADMVIREGFFGENYGIPTPEGREAVELFNRKEGVYLENTYTGKAAAALLHDIEGEALQGESILYWNTLNSRDFSDQIQEIDYRALPLPFHPYFERIA